MLASVVLCLTALVQQAISNQIELILVFEVAKIQLQNDGILDVAGHVNLEWNSTASRPPHIFVEQMIREERSTERQEETSSGSRRVRYFTKIAVLCDGTDFSSYPRDSHVCQLRFSSTLNSSRLLFLPHLVENPSKIEDVWKREGSKSFVQWWQSGNQSYEMAVFEFHLQRSAGSLSVIVWLSFFLNVFAVCHHFPFLTDQSQANRQVGCWVVLIQALICCHLALSSPSIALWSGIVRFTFGFFAFSVVSSILATLTPSLVLHLHLVPFEAHPAPCDVPIPSEHYSLDSERTRFSAILDSARLDSSRTPRSANIELCMAELKYTLASLNETMNAKSTAAWRKRLWSTGYGRVETALAVILHGANVCLLLFALH